MNAICINNTGWIGERGLFWGLIRFWIRCSDGPAYLEEVRITGSQHVDGEMYYELNGYGDDLFIADQFIIIDSGELHEGNQEVDAPEYMGAVV